MYKVVSPLCVYLSFGMALLLLLFSIVVAENHGSVPVGYGYCPLPSSWTCSPYAYNSGDKCDCNCGIYDPGISPHN